MKRGVLLVALLVMAALLVTSVCYAKKGVVKVRVVDVDGKGKEKRVEGASVQIWDKEGNIVKEKPTDEDGNVEFGGLEGDTEYVIRVLAPDGKQGNGGFTTNKHGGAGLQVVEVKPPG